MSVNFNLKGFFNFINKILKLFKNDKVKLYKQEDIQYKNKEINLNKDESLVQVDLPFNNEQNNQKIKSKYKLPTIDFLKLPTKKERESKFL